MKNMCKIFIVSIALIAVIVTVHAAEQRERAGARGVIKSVDAASNTIVFDSDGTEQKVTVAQNPQIFKEEAADESALKEGVHVEINGTVAEDKSSVSAARVFAYIPKGRGFDMVAAKRVDGDIAKEGDTLVVKAKSDGQEYTIKLEKADGFEVRTRTWTELGQVPTGVSAWSNGFKTDDGGVEIYMLTFQAQ